MPKPKIKIDIVSDVVCPWCYIGKRRLEKAIQQVSDQYDFELIYLPFELNPHISKTGVDQKEYLSDKFGGDEQYERITQHTTAIAATEGLSFNFEKQNVSPNTRSLHALIDMAKEEGVQHQVVETFFKAYFTDGIDLSKSENIIALAVQSGLNKEKTEQRLSNENAMTKIALMENEIQKLGVRGVPFYIINDKYGMSGAQPAETFIKIFDDINAASTTDGEACNVDAKSC